jgi:hypothetical protein
MQLLYWKRNINFDIKKKKVGIHLTAGAGPDFREPRAGFTSSTDAPGAGEARPTYRVEVWQRSEADGPRFACLRQEPFPGSSRSQATAPWPMFTAQVHLHPIAHTGLTLFLTF